MLVRLWTASSPLPRRPGCFNTQPANGLSGREAVRLLFHQGLLPHLLHARRVLWLTFSRVVGGAFRLAPQAEQCETLAAAPAPPCRVVTQRIY
jgi:hypothetical protein